MNKKSFRLILSNEMTRENILIYCTDNLRLHEKVVILHIDQLLVYGKKYSGWYILIMGEGTSREIFLNVFIGIKTGRTFLKYARNVGGSV